MFIVDDIPEFVLSSLCTKQCCMCPCLVPVSPALADGVWRGQDSQCTAAGGHYTTAHCLVFSLKLCFTAHSPLAS